MPKYYQPKFVRLPEVKYDVLLDGVLIRRVDDYLCGLAMCIAWRQNNPREDIKRIKLQIVI